MRRGVSAAPSSALAAQTADAGHLPSNGVVDGLDPLMSFVEEKLCWEILRWLRRDNIQGGDAGLPADLGRFDLSRPLYSWGVHSSRDVRSPRQTWTGDWKRELRGTPWPPSPPCPVVLICP